MPYATQTICHFSNLSQQFDQHPVFTGLSATLTGGLTGLLGRNAQGKSVLLALLARLRPASSGHVRWFVPFHHVGQLQRLQGTRIADALGVGALYDCFERLQAGTADEADYLRLEGYWHLPPQWDSALHEAGLSFPLSAPVAHLSGGEQTRLALCRAFLLPDHYLLLDEPGNHLDADGHQWLQTRLAAHPAGALLVTHERTLLQQVARILELDQHGLHDYGGNYAVYRNIRDAQNAALDQQLGTLKQQQRQQQRKQQDALEKAAQRRKQGEGQRDSQSRLLLGARKNRADSSLSQLKQQQRQRSVQLASERQGLQEQQETIKPQSLRFAPVAPAASLCLHASALQLPHVQHPPLTLTLHQGERWQIQGSNGSGKSTLLRVIAGLEQPRAGRCSVHGRCVYLDQHFSLLDAADSALGNLQRLHPDQDETRLRTALAGLRLRGDKSLTPIHHLSGGERLKVALLAVLLGEQAPNLLLLDEPDNHLDLDSRLLLEQTLASYPGTLLLVSHDPVLVEALNISRSLQLGPAP
ncbi:MAG TPA: ATP-binding cassette domain-containing protein [Thiolinea sp.]|nr:ATP-binding cassette domain-containing protein [Thiolinea sp.]